MKKEVIGQVQDIYSYPIKSCGAMRLTSATLTPAGIVGDREFMVVRSEPSADGVLEFVTQRDKRDRADQAQGLAVLALIKPQPDGDGLNLTWKDEDPIQLPLDNKLGTENKVLIWGEIVYAIDQGNQIAKWLSEHLNLSVRLVKASGRFNRMSRQNYQVNDNHLRFQDGYPIHWFFKESVDELSQMAGETISHQVFRPNIVLSGSPAQTEHVVYAGEIEGVPFTNPKPCDRCPTTNVNQETGEIKVGRALSLLAKFKRWRNNEGVVKVIFGENMLPQATGEIHIGSEMILMGVRDPELVVEYQRKSGID